MKNLLHIITLFLSFAAYSQADYSAWQKWQETSCYSKISFRLKDEGLKGEQYVWKIQFKNDFNELISFNYTITDALQQHTITTHRKTLADGGVSNEIEVFATQETIYIIVDKVSLSPYPDDFIDCDKN